MNQFLGTHGVGLIAYQGNLKVTGAAAVNATLDTNTGAAAQWIAQPFTTIALQTTVTRIEMMPTLVGTGADLTIDIQSNAAGSPSGVVLATITFPKEFQPAGATYVSFPLNVTGLVAATLYHIVVHGTASTTNFARFQLGNQNLSRTQISSNGVTWANSTLARTAMFNIYADVNGLLRNTYEDSGARWTGFDYAANSGPLSTIREYTGALRSSRTITYGASGLPTGIA